MNADALSGNGPQTAIDFIAHWEGLAKVGPDGLIHPYVDVAGVPTIGYGFTHLGLIKTAPHPIERMQHVLRWLVVATEAHAIRLSPILLTATEHQRAAITSFIYNLGDGAYAASTLRKRVNANDIDGAVVQIKRWVYAGGKKVYGLKRRRAAEAALLLR